eukprot:Colp12_sorted_trinity150504_noHs@14552
MVGQREDAGRSEFPPVWWVVRLVSHSTAAVLAVPVEAAGVAEAFEFVVVVVESTPSYRSEIFRQRSFLLRFLRKEGSYKSSNIFGLRTSISGHACAQSKLHITYS